jgi:hypothetical protein
LLRKNNNESVEVEFSVNAGEIKILPVRVEIDPYLLKSTTSSVLFTIQDTQQTKYVVIEQSSFIKPSVGSRQ